MRRKPPVFLIVFLLLFFVIVYSMVKEPHSFDKSECGTCHRKDRSGNIVRDQLTAPVTVLCKRCHGDIFSEGYLHPVDVKARRAMVPGDMPLSREGNITCNTCHDIHSSFFTPYGEKSHYLRRYEPGRLFCEACHEDLAAPATGHKGTLTEAHFRSSYIATDPSQEIDAMSKNCISCHDGSFSTSSTIHVGTWNHGTAFMRYDQGSHPIGVDYEAARAKQRRKTDLRPLSMIDPRMRFFDGRVGCGTCHDPYSENPKKLVMTNEGSRLCLTCHMIDRR